jgi:hypothetical protein
MMTESEPNQRDFAWTTLETNDNSPQILPEAGVRAPLSLLHAQGAAEANRGAYHTPCGRDTAKARAVRVVVPQKAM